MQLKKNIIKDITFSNCVCVLGEHLPSGYIRICKALAWLQSINLLPRVTYLNICLRNSRLMFFTHSSKQWGFFLKATSGGGVSGFVVNKNTANLQGPVGFNKTTNNIKNSHSNPLKTHGFRFEFYKRVTNYKHILLSLIHI